MQNYGEKFAKVYNKRWANFSQSLAPKIHDLFEFKRSRSSLHKTILDLCCGTGQLSNFFLEKDYLVFGVDLSPYMIELAKENNKKFIETKRASFSIQNAENFTIDKPVSFAVSLFDALNHLPGLNSLQSCFKQVYNCLEDEGIFLFDLNTKKGLLQIWNGISMQDDDEMTIITKGISSEDIGKAYTQISGFIKNELETYDKFTETIYNTIFDLHEVKESLNKAKFKKIYFTRPEDFSKEIEYPENERRIFVVAEK